MQSAPRGALPQSSIAKAGLTCWSMHRRRLSRSAHANSTSLPHHARDYDRLLRTIGNADRKIQGVVQCWPLDLVLPADADSTQLMDGQAASAAAYYRSLSRWFTRGRRCQAACGS